MKLSLLENNLFRFFSFFGLSISRQSIVPKTGVCIRISALRAHTYTYITRPIILAEYKYAARRGKAAKRSNIVAVRAYAYAFFLLTAARTMGSKTVPYVNNLYDVSYEMAK